MYACVHRVGACITDEVGPPSLQSARLEYPALITGHGLDTIELPGELVASGGCCNVGKRDACALVEEALAGLINRDRQYAAVLHVSGTTSGHRLTTELSRPSVSEGRLERFVRRISGHPSIQGQCLLGLCRFSRRKRGSWGGFLSFVKDCIGVVCGGNVIERFPDPCERIHWCFTDA